MSSDLSRGKRLLAWSGITFGVVTALLAGTILILDGKVFPALGMLVFSLVLVIDRAMYLRGVFTARWQLPVWNRVWIAANLLLMGSVMFNLFVQNDVNGRALLAGAGAIALSMVVLLLAILMSGASWNGETGPKRS
jgi:hypothetical protein